MFGISRDSPWTHIAWAQTLDLKFPLVSDWNAEAVHAFDIAFEFRGKLHFDTTSCVAKPASDPLRIVSKRPFLQLRQTYEILLYRAKQASGWFR